MTTQHILAALPAAVIERLLASAKAQGLRVTAYVALLEFYGLDLLHA